MHVQGGRFWPCLQPACCCWCMSLPLLEPLPPPLSARVVLDKLRTFMPEMQAANAALFQQMEVGARKHMAVSQGVPPAAVKNQKPIPLLRMLLLLCQPMRATHLHRMVAYHTLLGPAMPQTHSHSQTQPASAFDIENVEVEEAEEGEGDMEGSEEEEPTPKGPYIEMVRG